MIRPSKTYGRKKVMDRFGAKIASSTLYGEAADIAYRIGSHFALRTDGATDKGAEKQYWLLAGPLMLTNEAPYIFGTYLLNKEESVKMRQELEAVGDLILYSMGIKSPEDHGWWTVICKYEPGAGVGGHKDNDFDSDFHTCPGRIREVQSASNEPRRVAHQLGTGHSE